MYTNIDIKEEDPLSVTENESQFFLSKTKSGVDNDCHVAIKSETPFTDFTSLEHEECFIKHHVKQIKSETIICSNSCEEGTKIEINSEKNREQFPADSLRNVEKQNSDHEMANKIETKEEPLWLDAETSSGCNDIKDWDFAAVKSPRLCTEAVSADAREDSSLICAATSWRNTRCRCRRNGPDCEIQENNVIQAPLVEHVNSLLSSEYRDDDDSFSRASSIHSSKAPLQCNICEKRFTRLLHLKMHNLIHEGKKPYECEICEKKFTELSNLKKHKVIHEGRKDHKCETCGKKFTYLSNLRTHHLVHEGKKPHKCPICEKRFTHLSSLKTHNLVHEGKKPHKCEICEKRFTQLIHLKSHNLSHEGKTPFKCQICEKRFTHLSNFKTHNLIHEGKKTHKCEICEKRFAHLSSLKAHNLIHVGNKPHKCQICEKKFTHLSNLKRHNLIHEGKKPHKCQICEKRFTQFSHLKTHNLTHERKHASQILNL